MQISTPGHHVAVWPEDVCILSIGHCPVEEIVEPRKIFFIKLTMKHFEEYYKK
jgi:hypothetical protein